MLRCKWDNLANKKVYFDWHHRRMFATMQIRNAFYRLGKQLADEKQEAKALEVIKKSEQIMSLRNWPVDYQSILLAGLYAQIGQKQLAQTKFQELANSLEEELNYYISFPANQKESVLNEADYQLSLYNELINQAADSLSEPALKVMKEKLMVFAGKLS